MTLNLGNAYDVRHGIFTAPFDGVYEFTVAVLNRAGVQTGLELVRNGESITKVQSSDNGFYTMGTNAASLWLKAGVYRLFYTYLFKIESIYYALLRSFGPVFISIFGWNTCIFIFCFTTLVFNNNGLLSVCIIL